MTPSAMTVSPEKEVSSYLEQARAFTINSQDDLATVDAHCAAGLALKKKIESDFKDSKATTYAAWKAVVAQEKGHLDGIDEGRRVDKMLIDTWNTEQARLAAIAALEAQAVEKKRLEDEALARAARAEEFGDAATADAIIAAPIVTAPVAAYVAPKTSTVFQTRWGAVVGGMRLDGTPTDALFVLKAIESAGKFIAKLNTPQAEVLTEILRQAHTDAKYMVYDQVALNKQATATKDAIVLGGAAFVSRKV